jgi:hypothetical protein
MAYTSCILDLLPSSPIKPRAAVPNYQQSCQEGRKKMLLFSLERDKQYDNKHPEKAYLIM